MKKIKTLIKKTYSLGFELTTPRSSGRRSNHFAMKDSGFESLHFLFIDNRFSTRTKLCQDNRNSLPVGQHSKNTRSSVEKNVETDKTS